LQLTLPLLSTILSCLTINDITRVHSVCHQLHRAALSSIASPKVLYLTNAHSNELVTKWLTLYRPRTIIDQRQRTYECNRNRWPLDVEQRFDIRNKAALHDMMDVWNDSFAARHASSLRTLEYQFTPPAIDSKDIYSDDEDIGSDDSDSDHPAPKKPTRTRHNNNDEKKSDAEKAADEAKKKAETRAKRGPQILRSYGHQIGGQIQQLTNLTSLSLLYDWNPRPGICGRIGSFIPATGSLRSLTLSEIPLATLGTLATADGLMNLTSLCYHAWTDNDDGSWCDPYENLDDTSDDIDHDILTRPPSSADEEFATLVKGTPNLLKV
jgi:hypothetical protein